MTGVGFLDIDPNYTAEYVQNDDILEDQIGKRIISFMFKHWKHLQPPKIVHSPYSVNQLPI